MDGGRRRRRSSRWGGVTWLVALACACGGHVAKDGAKGSAGSSAAGDVAGTSGGTASHPRPATGDTAEPDVGGTAGPDAGGTSSSSDAGNSHSEAGNISSEGGAPEQPIVPRCGEASLDCIVGAKSDFGLSWQSSWFLMGCKDKQGHDCVNNPTCPNPDATNFEDVGISTLETFPISGIPGQRYKVTFTFNGLASAKDYAGGKRDQGESVPVDVDTVTSDAFYRDGQPIRSNYDTWKLSVFDEHGVEVRHYFMNSFPLGMGFESHRTFLLGYTKSIVVVGGGKVTHFIHDPNCHSIDNCGPPNRPDDFCDARSLPNEPVNVLLPPMYQDPEDKMLKETSALSELNPTALQPWHSQLGHLTVTAVEATDDPVTTDYP